MKTNEAARAAADRAEQAAREERWLDAQTAADEAEDAAPGSDDARRADQAAEGGRAATWREALQDPSA